MSSLDVLNAASLWYPVMLAQMAEEISEAKAAELLALNIEQYREKKHQAIQAVMRFVSELPSPLISLLDAMKAKQ